MTISNIGAGFPIDSGNAGNVRMITVGTPATASVSATLTVDQLATQLIRVNQAASGATTLTLPTGTLMDAAFSNVQVGRGFDFSVNNISTVAAEDATIAAGTGWTLYGSMVVASNDAATSISAGTFRATRTAALTWTLDRIS